MTPAVQAPEEKLLEIAVAQGYLTDGSTVEDLTEVVKQRMIIDTYILKDAIRLHYLPPGSTIKDLTSEVKGRMLNSGCLKQYSANGSSIHIFD